MAKTMTPKRKALTHAQPGSERAVAERCAEIAENCSGAYATARAIRAYAATLPQPSGKEKCTYPNCKCGGPHQLVEECPRKP